MWSGRGHGKGRKRITQNARMYGRLKAVNRFGMVMDANVHPIQRTLFGYVEAEAAMPALFHKIPAHVIDISISTLVMLPGLGALPFGGPVLNSSESAGIDLYAFMPCPRFPPA